MELAMLKRSEAVPTAASAEQADAVQHLKLQLLFFAF